MVAARHGAWVGWTGHPDTQAHAVERDDLRLHPIALSRQEVDDYHRGQCASTLSPLYHNRVEPPTFRKRWRDAYREVNQRFAKATADIAAPGGVAWIHDYHLQLVPGQLRRLRPDLLIGFFLHQPFPPAELFLQLPTRTEIISGLLGADLVGFQQPQAAATFLNLANRLLGLPVNDGVVMAGGRRVAVGTFPVPIDAAEVQSLATDPHVQAQAADIRTSLNTPHTIFLAVSRLDEADGIEQRLDAYAELLASQQFDPTHTVLIEVTEPTDADTSRRERLRARIDRRVGQINGDHARVGHPVVHYTHRHLALPERVVLYLAADVMLATPLTAGATLPAQEFLAARTDDAGQLVLSELAATDLDGAIMVNPYDPEALGDAMLAAAADARHTPAALKATRERLRSDSVEQWAGQFLHALGTSVATSTRQQHVHAKLLPVPAAQTQPFIHAAPSTAGRP